jgi:hypothetical protein
MRTPLASILSSRDGTLEKDGLLTNCYVESAPEGKMIVKRPGFQTFASLGVGCGQGSISYNGGALFVKSDAVTVDLQPVASGVTWSSASSSPGMGIRVGGGLWSLNGSLYYAGGGTNTSGQLKNDVWKSDDNGLTWTLILASAPWSARALFGYCVFNNQMWVMGGTTARSGNDFLSSTASSEVWSSLDGLTWVRASSSAGFGQRAGMSVVVHNGLMFMYGGYTFAGTYKDDVLYSIDGSTWTTASSGATGSGRIFPMLGSLNGELFIVGGQASGGRVKTVYKSSTNGVTWSLLTSTPGFTEIESAGLVTYDDRMWLFGGAIGGGATADNTVWTTQTGSSWGSVTASPGWTDRTNFAFTLHNDTYYIYGGGARNSSFVAVINPVEQDVWYATPASATNTTITPTINCRPMQLTLIPANGSTQNKVFIKSDIDAWVYDGSSATKVTDGDYPITTVPGVVCLNGAIYVMGSNGQINGSDIYDGLSWDALNFITANAEGDEGIALARQLNYIIAFKSYSTEVFYDAGNPTGSPLAKVQNALLEIGCASASSIAYSDNTIYFMANSKQNGRSVMRMNGYTPEQVSTPFVDKILNDDDLDTVYSFMIKSEGHLFYVLTLKTSGITLAYDAVENSWSRALYLQQE